ncbi:MAG: Histidine--tRNA ligase [Firmicutes bacterium ADurb.Bin193]|nr:MAG: Histidine--tRNA ligase [Firmicutes bacterium ADurb.Bin193]
MLTKAPRGTKDVTPDEVYKWQYVEEKIRQSCRLFGFKEIRVPVFEHTELYERGVGDTTDVVQKEMYTFNDKGGRSITLRPEGTAGVVRAFVENNLYAQSAPTKLFYILSCYRYEKPQAGRLREFNQFGTEVFGAASPETDAEVISLAQFFLKSLGLDDLKLSLNSVGCSECRREYNKKLISFFDKYRGELCTTCIERLEKNPMRIIDCKNKECKAIGENAPMIVDCQCDKCKAYYESVKTLVKKAGIKFVEDGTIVRGLDYYTTTVFEIKSGDLVVCGGGRYDNLVKELGGPQSPGMGFGLGLERLIMVLESKGVLPPKPAGCDIYIVCAGEDIKPQAQRLVGQLRNAGISTETDLMNRSVKAQMKYADKIGARFVAVLGGDEINAGIVNIKNMSTGDEIPVKLKTFTDEMRGILCESEK